LVSFRRRESKGRKLRVCGGVTKLTPMEHWGKEKSVVGHVALQHKGKIEAADARSFHENKGGILGGKKQRTVYAKESKGRKEVRSRSTEKKTEKIYQATRESPGGFTSKKTLGGGSDIIAGMAGERRGGKKVMKAEVDRPNEDCTFLVELRRVGGPSERLKRNRMPGAPTMFALRVRLSKGKNGRRHGSARDALQSCHRGKCRRRGPRQG